MSTATTPDASASEESTARGQLIKTIHVGRREVQMSDEAWRTYLQLTFAAASSTQLTMLQLRRALAHLRRIGFKPKFCGGEGSGRPEHEWSFADRMPLSKRPLLYKILKLMEAPELGVAKGSQVAYVEGIAKQMGGCNVGRGSEENVYKPLPLCSVGELRRIVGALAIHIQRVLNRGDAAANA